MHIEKKLLKFSLTDAIRHFALLFMLLNGPISLFTVIQGNPRFLTHDSSWIMQILFPVVYSLIWTSVNRNGILKLTECNEPQAILKQIDSSLKRKYKKIELETGDYAYTKRTQWARCFNYFSRENVTIQPAADGCQIFAKKNLLDSIEMKIKYNRRN